jgi:hypothetical protein
MGRTKSRSRPCSNSAFPGAKSAFPDAQRREFGDALLRSRRSSIDTFLEWNLQFAEIGKLAIAHQLIKCEKAEHIFQPPKNPIGRPIGGDDWYKYFFNSMLLSGSPEEFARKRLLVLTFNYDRSFEFALFNAIKYSYTLSDQDAQKLMTTGLRTLHLHGDLGALFESDATLDQQRDFTPVLTPESVRIAQRRLRVVHDDSHDALAVYDGANEALKAYEIVCFLGFSYNEMSLQRLRPGLVVNHSYDKPRSSGEPRSVWRRMILPASIPASAEG